VSPTRHVVGSTDFFFDDIQEDGGSSDVPPISVAQTTQKSVTVTFI
jgi:hypothetical protein